MDTALELLGQVDIQSLTTSERRLALTRCHAITLQLKATDALQYVRDVQSFEFQFATNALSRLKALLDKIQKDNSRDRLGIFQDFSPELVIVCGLCMTVKDIIRTQADLWDEIITQARPISERLIPYLAQSAQITAAVNSSSNNNFKKRYEALQRDQGIFNRISHIKVNDVYCFHYTAPHMPGLELLARLSYTGTVALYMPDLPRDGLLRITMRWDENFLAGLFAYQTEVHDAAGFVAYSIRAHVAQYLGAYISSAIETSDMRAAELPENIVTQCVKCQGFPGQVIMVDVTVSKAECINIMEFV
ncbi:hypothetical protein FOQG_19580 [Fusarium oxysporum f. sp. raphani 54005]|uniref:Uncharacterized protein n=2 Tax=Fusarium oxysporum f. sp. raphani TaxID=96318 RepID=X0BAY5_FUSOX|nr:hypothetical protein FOQG_19580 [Fusarium oxysporum f. sp. raphani 54005]KAG7427849.1 hypothetical protein Forpi1262_v011034 [Fusarium oxysporum f. sp. raphani]